MRLKERVHLRYDLGVPGIGRAGAAASPLFELKQTELVRFSKDFVKGAVARHVRRPPVLPADVRLSSF